MSRLSASVRREVNLRHLPLAQYFAQFGLVSVRFVMCDSYDSTTSTKFTQRNEAGRCGSFRAQSVPKT